MNIPYFYRLIIFIMALVLTLNPMLSQVSVYQTSCTSLKALIFNTPSVYENNLRSYTLEELKSEGVWASLGKNHTKSNNSEFNNLSKGIYRVKVVSFRPNDKNLLVSDPINITGCPYNENQELKDQDVFIWPNPSSGIVEIKIISKIDFEEPFYATIYNSQGSKIDEKKIFETYTTFSIEHLPSGIYHISVRSNSQNLVCNKIFTKK